MSKMWFFECGCSKWKQLFLEEKKKYEDLKKWTEELLKSNTELLNAIQENKDK
jgi:hypothetical protein